MDATRINSSQLSERVTLHKPSETTNSFNETETTYPDTATVWAEIEEGGGREFYGAEALRGEKRIRAKIRWRTDIDRSWRFTWKDQEYRIVDIAEIRRHKGLVLSGTSET